MAAIWEGEVLIITNSSIGMDSARTYTSVSTDAYLHTKSVASMSVNQFYDALTGAYEDVHEKAKSGENDEKTDKENTDTLSGNAESSLEYLKGKFSEISTAKAAKTSKAEEDLKSAIRYLVLNFLLMLLFGKNAGKDGFSSTDLASDDTSSGSINDFLNNSFSTDSLQFTKTTESITFEHFQSEYEETTFSGKGIVKTSDGREIDFNIDVTMSRSMENYAKVTGTYESIGMKFIDPLVINLDSAPADISDQKFYFDLDCDGTDDEISMLGTGSGFLALDLNEDGRINDGSELFGTKSGDGFKDISRYDEDGNGWIDEADSVFDKLKIFAFNEDGSESLYTLKDKGVGAIYLGSRETEFSVNNQENITNAQVRRTGLFLYESGMAGTMQHIDMAVSKITDQPVSYSA